MSTVTDDAIERPTRGVDIGMARKIPLDVHLLDLETISGGARRPLSRLLLRTVLAERLGTDPARVPLTVHRLGRPLLPGERPETGRASVAHDRGVLVVAQHPGGCGVDVEDADPRLLADVAYRFCAPTEDTRTGPRGLWAVKESVAKSLGLGLAADLRTITAVADPAVGWTSMAWRGAALGRIATVVASGDRHLALTVPTDRPPRVVVRCWGIDQGGSLHEIRPAGPLAALAAAVISLQHRGGGDVYGRHAA